MERCKARAKWEVGDDMMRGEERECVWPQIHAHTQTHTCVSASFRQKGKKSHERGEEVKRGKRARVKRRWHTHTHALF